KVSFGSETVMVCEVEKLLVPFRPRHPHLLHVVVKDVLGPSAKVFKRQLVTAKQARHLHARRKVHEELPRVAHHHHENVQANAPYSVVNLSTVGPVCLSLFAGSGLKADSHLLSSTGLSAKLVQVPAHCVD